MLAGWLHKLAFGENQPNFEEWRVCLRLCSQRRHSILFSPYIYRCAPHLM